MNFVNELLIRVNFNSGSGKSYTMMGSHDNTDAGIIPRLCNVLFERIALDRDNPACQV